MYWTNLTVMKKMFPLYFLLLFHVSHIGSHTEEDSEGFCMKLLKLQILSWRTRVAVIPFIYIPLSFCCWQVGRLAYQILLAVLATELSMILVTRTAPFEHPIFQGNPHYSSREVCRSSSELSYSLLQVLLVGYHRLRRIWTPGSLQVL
jgi:hypothetical protein